MRCRFTQTAALAAAIGIFATGCGIPRDPENSFERIARTGVLRAGITARPPFTTDAGGPEAAFVNAFAASHGARVEWRRGSESELFEALERFEIEVVVGGFTHDNPWGPKLGMTRPYLEADGKKHVIAVAPGENRLLLEVERALRAHAASIAGITGGTPKS